MLYFSQDNFFALGRELVNARIASFTQALADHASTEGVPAPTDHPLIERIVRGHGGQYTVREPGALPVTERIAAIEAAIDGAARVVALEQNLGLTPAKGATIADRVDAIEAAFAEVDVNNS